MSYKTEVNTSKKAVSINDLPTNTPIVFNECTDRLEHIAKNIGDYKQWIETTDGKEYYLFNNAVGYTGYSFTTDENPVIGSFDENGNLI